MIGHTGNHPPRSPSSAAIVGASTIVVSKHDGPRRTPLQLQVVAARDALEQAGVGRQDIGILLTARAPQAYEVRQFNMRMLNELKIVPTFTSEVTAHGAGALGMVQFASILVSAGMAEYALCTCGTADAMWLDPVSTNASVEADPQFEGPYSPTTPALYAQIARRYMHETGATREQFARAAVENRKWALAHPQAAMHDAGELTIADVLSARPIATPFTLLDCAPWYPGGIASAVVVTSSARAARHSGETTYILGFGQCDTHEWLTERLELSDLEPPFDVPSLTRTGARVAARQSYEMAGLGPGDIDLVQTSAPFSALLPLMLEELGFTSAGHGGLFVEAGGVDFDGGLPFNTSGGYLSFGQSAQGLYLATECIEQLHRRAKGRQVTDAEVALVHGHGGPLACHSVMILGRSPSEPTSAS